MTQKLFFVCAVCALLFVFATANVASADEPVAPAICAPCGVVHAAPCSFNPCYVPPVAYRVGFFGVVRPVHYAPVYRPVYVAPRFYYAPYRFPARVYAW